MKILKSVLVTAALILPVMASAQDNSTTATTTTTVREDRGFDWGWLGLLGLAGLLGRNRQPEVRQTTTTTTRR